MRKILGSLVLTLAASAAIAQSPCFNQSLGTVIGNGDDIMLPIQSIGFAFSFGGQTYTDLHVSTNGFFYLSNAGVPAPGGANCCAGSTATLVAGSPMISPFWTDLNVIAANGGNVYVNSSPVSCLITWKNTVEYANSTVFDLQAEIDITGAIRFSYSSTMALATHTALTGMSPGIGSTVPATATDWSAGGATTTDTEYELYVGATFDLAGKSVFFTPTVPGYAFAAVPIPTSGCASLLTYGTGCVAGYGSFYEHFFTTPSIDLSNSAFQMIFTGGGYLVLPSTAAFVAPSGTATNLGLGDDAETMVTLSSAMPYPGGSTSTLNVCSNGHISAASNGAGGDYTPTPAEFLNWANATWAVWRDFISGTAGGAVKFEEIAGIAYVTWDAVVGYVGTVAGTTPSTFQLQFDLTSGNVTFVFLGMDTVSVSGWTGGEGWVVGFSSGGASADPGSVDLTTAIPATITTYAADRLPLSLAGSTMPTLGAVVGMNTSQIPTSAPFGAVMLGFSNPNVDLTAFGMPGCRQYTDGLASVLFLPFGNTTNTSNFTMPTGTSFLGVTVLAQAFAYAPAANLTPLGAISSNGLTIGIGL